MSVHVPLCMCSVGLPIIVYVTFSVDCSMHLTRFNCKGHDCYKFVSLAMPFNCTCYVFIMRRVGKGHQVHKLIFYEYVLAL